MTITKRLLLAICIYIDYSTCLAQSQLPENFLYQGVVTDDSTKNTIPFVNIFNESKRQGYSSDENGKFVIEAEIGDTLILSAIGYFSEVFFIPDTLSGNNITLKLEPRIYEIGEVYIKTMPSYQKLKQDFLKYKMPAAPTDSFTEALSLELKEVVKKVEYDKMVEKVFQREKGTLFELSQPILSAQQKEKNKHTESLKKAEQQRIIDKKFNREIIKKLTQIPENKISEFIMYCDFSFDYLLHSTEYDIALSIRKKYDEYLQSKQK